MADDEITQLAKSRVGRVLRGKYRLDRVLGIGGMATVYAATHRNKKRFAIKMLHPELSLRENIRTRFLREGYVANSVGHSGAVAVLDDDVAEDGSAFLVMELLEGTTVEDLRVDGMRQLPLSLVLAIGDAVLDVLTAAHAKGVVHRDLKPANLFVTNDGRLEVLDFGIARLHDETSASVGHATQTGVMMGTPAFMAPEQALAEASQIDGQTDLWAVGATLFTLLTGEVVHDGTNSSQLLVNAATKKARALASVLVDVPAPAAAVIDKALAFEKAERWASAKEMREALAAACREATGEGIPPLPKTAVTGLEDTIAPGEAFGSGSNPARAPGDVSFDSTVAADSAGSAPQSTDAAVSRTPDKVLRRPISGALVVVGVLATGMLAAVGLQRLAARPQLRYCDSDGISDVYPIDGPRCIGEITTEQLRGRSGQSRSYRFTEVHGRVARVDRVNFAGVQVDDEDRTTEITRNDDGTVREIVVHGPHGESLERQKWSEGGRRIDFVEDDGTTPRRRSPTQAYTTIRIEYDANGLVKRCLYFDAAGTPRGSNYGVFGWTFDYGRLGRFTRRTALGPDGVPAAVTHGYVTETQSDDNDVDGKELRFLDLTGHPVAVNGCFAWKRTWLKNHDLAEKVCLGPDDKPATSFESGIHGERRQWDPGARTLTVTTIDELGRDHARGGGASTYRKTFDARGRRTLTEALDPQGNPVVGRDGASTRFTWNEIDEEIKREYLDASGAPIQCSAGYSHRTCAFDAEGRVVEQRHYDETGTLAPWSNGPAIVRESYDARGLSVKHELFSAPGVRAAEASGAAWYTRRWDRQRNSVEVSSYGMDGHPITDGGGSATTRSTFAGIDLVSSQSFFDDLGAPTVSSGGYSVERNEFDTLSRVSAHRYFDTHGEPMLTRERYALVRYERDRNGDIASESYFGKHDEPILSINGYARETHAYDLRRQRIQTTLFDAAGAPIVGRSGWSTERVTYDQRGLVTREDHFDAAGNPALTNTGGASVVQAWDEAGHMLQGTTLGTDGKPLATIDGYATRKYAYNDRGELVGESLYGVDEKPAAGTSGWAIRKLRYDDRGNLVDTAFFDVEHRPVSPKGMGYASTRSRYDARQRLVETSWLDAGGAAAMGPDGVAIVRYQRDGYGRASETSYLDGAGVPTPSKQGKLVVRSKYDDAGRLTEERFVDGAGAPHAANDGCAGHRTKYDPQGRIADESCLAVGDGFALSSEGWAIRRTLHDARGNAVDISTYAPDGTLHAEKHGVAREKNRFDERGLRVETTYFDAADKATHNTSGVAIVRFEYDEAGEQTARSRFDEHGQPVSTKAEAAER